MQRTVARGLACGAMYPAFGRSTTRRDLAYLLTPPDSVDISSNQPATQVYTSYWLNIPRKAVHGGPDVNYTQWSAVAIEQQGYMDAINTPEWNIDQIRA